MIVCLQGDVESGLRDDSLSLRRRRIGPKGSSARDQMQTVLYTAKISVDFTVN